MTYKQFFLLLQAIYIVGEFICFSLGSLVHGTILAILSVIAFIFAIFSDN